ncbi:hypothetical protein D3C78_1145010 [compost metagenome]
MWSRSSRYEEVDWRRISLAAQPAAHLKGDNAAQTMSEQRIWTAVKMREQYMLNILHHLLNGSKQWLAEAPSSSRELYIDKLNGRREQVFPPFVNRCRGPCIRKEKYGYSRQTPRLLYQSYLRNAFKKYTHNAATSVNAAPLTSSTRSAPYRSEKTPDRIIPKGVARLESDPIVPNTLP